MTQNYQPPSVNPYEQDYQMPEYYIKSNQEYYQEQNKQQEYQEYICYPALRDKSNPNVNSQPLISVNEANEYTDSFSDVGQRATPAVIANINEHVMRKIPLWCKIFIFIEIIIDIICFLIYIFQI